ncbi:MAG: hypothetical protein DHS20C18_29820 [Saprospiraceae bacterium]|nr:MAG: hypothetical protein DHS20C18_29820 [Saprospiraceae bacterium]
MKKVALVVDEWGGWYQVEPGTNPGSLYQQNSIRDAMIARTTLNIFNNHCDRIVMANLVKQSGGRVGRKIKRTSLQIT